jgi:hypothetical protein
MVQAVVAQDDSISDTEELLRRALGSGR